MVGQLIFFRTPRACIKREKRLCVCLCVCVCLKSSSSYLCATDEMGMHVRCTTHRRVDLEETRLAREVEPTDKERHAKRSDTTLLGVLLHHRPQLSNQLKGRDRLLVDSVVLLRELAALRHEHTRIRAHPTVHHPNRIRQLHHLVQR